MHRRERSSQLARHRQLSREHRSGTHLLKVDLAGHQHRAGADAPEVLSADPERGGIRLVDVNEEPFRQAVAIAKGPEPGHQARFLAKRSAGKVVGPVALDLGHAVEN